jgi:hypothetical protein
VRAFFYCSTIVFRRKASLEERGRRSAALFWVLPVHADFLKLGRFRSGFLGFAQGSRDFFPVLGDGRNLGQKQSLL